MIASPVIEDITAIVLAGGRGQRVKEQDKGLIDFSGKKLVKHVIDSLSMQTKNIVVVANRNIQTYTDFGYPVVSDRIQGFQGPLAGIDAAFSSTGSSFLFCVPCDSPFIPNDVIQQFIKATTGNNPIVVASDGHRLHPVISLIHRSVWPDIENRLAQGQLRLMDWIESAGYDVVDFSTCPNVLQNLNTMDDMNSVS